MISDKLISVVIPCFNAEKYIADCLTSVIEQDYRPIEIICVNDGSSDRTIDVLRSYCRAYKDLIQIIDINNMGAPHARNIGLKQATGTYLQFLDADDLLLPGKFSTQILKMNNADVVVSDRIIKNTNLSETLEEISFAHIEDNPLEIAFREIIITGNPIYRISKVREIEGYREDLLSAQDWDFHIRLILAGAVFKYAKGVFFLTRQVPGSISSNWVSVSEQCCIAIETLKQKLENHESLTSAIRNHIAVIYFASAARVKDHDKLKSYLQELEFWSKGSFDFLGNRLKKMIARTFGLSFLITLERLRY